MDKNDLKYRCNHFLLYYFMRELWQLFYAFCFYIGVRGIDFGDILKLFNRKEKLIWELKKLLVHL